jgi:hypothetical protein
MIDARTSLDPPSTAVPVGVNQGIALSDRAVDILNVLAVGTLFIDHLVRGPLRTIDPQLWSQVQGFGIAFGRLAFPLLALTIAHDLERSRSSHGRIILRLCFFGGLAFFPFIELFGPTLNLLFTVALGVGLHWAMRRPWRFGGVATLGLGLLAFLLGTFCEYPAGGVFAVCIAAWLLRTGTNLHWGLWLAYMLTINFWNPLALTAVLVPGVVDLVRKLRGGPFLRAYWLEGLYPAHLIALLALTRWT